jgi:hypothetical protein
MAEVEVVNGASETVFLDTDEEDVIDDEQVDEFKEQLEALGNYPVSWSAVVLSTEYGIISLFALFCHSLVAI